MEVNGLRFSDDFRMHSPVVWFCLGAVVLCALSVESGAQRSYHVIHQQASPIYRSVVPTFGYTNIGPAIFGRGLERQEDDYEDEEDEEEEDEDDENEPDIFGQGGAPPDPDPYAPFEEEQIEEEEEDEEDEEEDEDDYVVRHDENEVEGRQAFINNQYIDQSNVQSSERGSNVQRNDHRMKHQDNYFVSRQDNRAKPQSSNRVPPNKNDRKPTQGSPNKVNSNTNKPSRPNRRKPKPTANEGRPALISQQAVLSNNINNNKDVEPDAPQKVTNIASNNLVDNTKQKLQLRPVATSTQFIATPVADLILRLSISLAKPMGHGNSTIFNVPVRFQQGALKSVVDNEAINLVARKTETELNNISTTTTTASPKVENVEQEEEEEAEEKEKDSVAAVTEMPMK